MQQPLDGAVIAAIVSAAASIMAAVLAYLATLVAEVARRRRDVRTHLMQIRNEMAVNHGLAKAIAVHTRTYGIRFLDRVWTSADTSSIYLRGIPSEKILDVYSSVQIFNTLNERYSLISQKPDYGPDKDQRLAQEHAEMVALAEKIARTTEDVLHEIRG